MGSAPTLPDWAALCDDCLHGLGLLEPGSVDMVFADLPYGTTMSTWDRIIPMAALWPALRRVCKPNAAMVFTAVQPFASLLVTSNFDSFGYEVIWRKNKATNFLNVQRQPLRQHESVLVFYDQPPKYYPQMTTGHAPGQSVRGRVSDSECYGTARKPRSYGGNTDRYPITVIDIPVVDNKDPQRIHPNQKPEELAGWFIRTHTDPGDTVLDPTFGSGSTLLAAKWRGRRAVGFEKNSHLVSQVNALLARIPAPPIQT